MPHMDSSNPPVGATRRSEIPATPDTQPALDHLAEVADEIERLVDVDPAEAADMAEPIAASLAGMLEEDDR